MNGTNIIARNLSLLVIFAIVAGAGGCKKNGGDVSPESIAPDTTTWHYTKSNVKFTGPASYTYGSTDSAQLYITKEGAAALLSSNYYQGSLSKGGYFIHFRKDTGAAIVRNQPYALQSGDVVFASSSNPTPVYYYPGAGCAITFSALDSSHVAGVISGSFNASTGVGSMQAGTCTFDFSN